MTPDPDSFSFQHDEFSDEDDQEVLDLPMYLVDGEDAEDLLHPEVAITRRVNAHPDDPGTESIIFRQEDYTEQGDEHWNYGGLIPLDPAVYEYDDDLTPEELAEARASEPEAWDYPEHFDCPNCAGEAEMLEGPTGEETCAYICQGCSLMMLLERRPSIRNAAVLLVSRYGPMAG